MEKHNAQCPRVAQGERAHVGANRPLRARRQRVAPRPFASRDTLSNPPQMPSRPSSRPGYQASPAAASHAPEDGHRRPPRWASRNTPIGAARCTGASTTSHSRIASLNHRDRKLPGRATLCQVPAQCRLRRRGILRGGAIDEILPEPRARHRHQEKVANRPAGRSIGSRNRMPSQAHKPAGAAHASAGPPAPDNTALGSARQTASSTASIRPSIVGCARLYGRGPTPSHRTLLE